MIEFTTAIRIQPAARGAAEIDPGSSQKCERLPMLQPFPWLRMTKAWVYCFGFRLYRVQGLQKERNVGAF